MANRESESHAVYRTGEGQPSPVRTCATCNEPLTGKTTKRYCDDTCRNKARTSHRPFVGIDGEGTRQNYVLLAAGNKPAIKNKKYGLSTEECLEYLLSLPRGASGGTRPIYVWFAMDYDVNMMLRDVPLTGDQSLDTLKTENTIRWRGYRITYLRRKILRIARGNRRHSSVDSWGFFQSSFEAACDSWGVATSPIIGMGKASRSGFDKWTLRAIEEYNQAELVALAELCEKLRESTLPLELPIQSWHGPAALADSWLSKNKAVEWLPGKWLEIEKGNGKLAKKWVTTHEDYCTPYCYDVFTRAYFGGRIDVLGYGKVDPVFHYDIVSAYPSAIQTLPDLTNLKWIERHGNKLPTAGGLYLARIRWKNSTGYWQPFPWRANNGSIRYPSEGEGWYWKSELESAIRKHPEMNYEILETITAEGTLTYPFRNLIQETFDYRAQLKREQNPSHKAIRLILNSLYGKFAQTVGKARYHSPIWAGIITAQTRSQLLDALTADVVCVMTDSLWSRKELTELPLGSNLGDWEAGNEVRLWLAEAGLYEAESEDGSSHVWQRGFDKRNPVDIRGLVDGWLRGEMGNVSYKVNRFIGYALAIHAPHAYRWREWMELERRIEPVPLVGTTKREPVYPNGSESVSSSGFVVLEPRGRDGAYLSAPYKKLTLDPTMIEYRLQEEIVEE